MKRYACHRLYTHQGHFLKQAVVVIDEDGTVVHYTPFEDEQRATEWIGGIIILSHQSEAELEHWNSLSFSEKLKGFPVFAWHLSHFDFEQVKPTPQSVLRRL